MTRVRRPPREIWKIRRGRKKSYFLIRLAALLHAREVFERAKQLPPGYPLRMLGMRGLVVRGRKMEINQHLVEILQGPRAMDLLIARLDLVQFECAAFLLLKDVATCRK